MSGREVHVVLGTGPLGLAVTRELRFRGRAVLAVSRSLPPSVPEGIETRTANLADPAQVCEVCRGAAVIYHCVHPPYTRWPVEFPPIQRAIIEGAASAGARLVFGDNLYMYGPVNAPLTEDMPYSARGPNGRLRAELASMVLAAHKEGKIKATIGRAADFFGPEVVESNMGERVFGAALRGKPAQILGKPDTLHTYTFIDDFAFGLVTLGERAKALGQAWHVPSSETLTIRRFIELVYEAAGARLRISAAPRAVVSVLALFDPLMRALKEQLYQFEKPFVVDHTKFSRAFGVHTTPHDTAIRATLAWYHTRDRKSGI